MSNEKIASLTVKIGEQNHSLITVWRGKFPGTYSIALDRGTDKYPAVNFIDAIKAFASRKAFVNVRIESEATGRPGHNLHRTEAPRGAPSSSDFDDDIRF